MTRLSRVPVPVITSQSRLNGRRYGLLFYIALAVGVAVPYLYSMKLMNRRDIYESTPFCDADGTCHEDPDRPSPRTIYSARSKEQYELWWKLHKELNRKSKEYARHRQQVQKAKSREKTRPLILLGDSITEFWLGTNMGLPEERAVGTPEVLKELISDRKALRLDPLVLAISGDQTQHLLYRLQNGQLLPAYATDPSAVFVVLIGTNNIGSGELPGPTAKGMLTVARYILNNTKGTLLLLKNLPRGDTFRLPRICPPRCEADGSPLHSFLPAINELNEAVEEGILQLRETPGGDRLSLLDCGTPFLAHDSDSEVERSLMPDLLHPNAVGHKILGSCFLDYLQDFLLN